MKRKLLKIVLGLAGTILILGGVLVGTGGLMRMITPEQLGIIDSVLSSTWLPMTLVRWAVLGVLITQWTTVVPFLISKMKCSSVSLSRVMAIRWHITIMVATLEAILLLGKLSVGF